MIDLTRHRPPQAPRVFTIPSGAPFLPTFVAALLQGLIVPSYSAAAGPLGLADATIYVPTRRSARALAAALANQVGATGTFVPRILPLGDIDAIETDALLDVTRMGAVFREASPIDPVARRMILTRLVLGWATAMGAPFSAVGSGRPGAPVSFRVASTPVDAWYLSGELATLLDELILADLDGRALAPLGTEAFDRYWSLTLDFLRIATEHWPAILAERGQVDPATQQKRLIDHEIARLSRPESATGPVIVAGVVGSDPLTTRLLAAIAGLPQGAVVLPGLDQMLDDASWTLLGGPEGVHGHPQVAFARVLAAMGLARTEVRPLGTVAPERAARSRLVSEALRPAETTDAWHGLAPGPGWDVGAALRGVSLIEAAHEGEEALALAVALRETLEGNGSAVLVTPDRMLARRVREELVRWGIEIDDSGGEPLAITPAGALAQLALDCMADGFEPVDVLALLAHPAVRLGRTRAEVAYLTRQAELLLLRGVVPKGALAQPRSWVAEVRHRVHESGSASRRERLTARLDEVEWLLVDLAAALAPLSAEGRTDLVNLLTAHDTAVAILTGTETKASALGGVDGTRLATLFSELIAHAEPGIQLDLGSYRALFGRIAGETTVRGPARSHPRLKILGLLEFRLLDADRVLLGGLDEAIWPPQVRTDAFLNRPMRVALGLASPELRIGQAAHDFELALGQPQVILSRAAKRGGSPTVPSRFLQRLAAVSGDAPWGACRARGQVYLDYARELDRPEHNVFIGRPCPKPPVELRPTSLSVTRVETLRRDPYAIYADKILGLRPLDPIGAAVGPREWGTAFHGVLRDFVERVRHGPVPPDALADLIRHAQATFEPLLTEPHTQAFMRPRLARWVEAFHHWDGSRRGNLAGLHVEAEGRLLIPLADGSQFELRATADRIERHGTGTIRLVDYKTGAAPSKKEVAAGFAPQLTLEAAIALAGGFAALDAVSGVDEAVYVRFGTGRELATTPLAWKDRTLDDVVAEHLDGLRDLLNAFRDPDVGYMARPFPQFVARFSDYDHLSRVKEWSATGGLGDPGAESGE